MKKVNNLEDIKDDSDELRKKKSSGEAVTDLMVPVPENRLLQKECEEIESNDEKNNVSTGNKECNTVLDTHDPLFASSMYEDVNSPEDFDDYDDDDDDDDEIVKESCNAKQTTDESCNAVENLQENCEVGESVQKCCEAGETAQNCFNAEEQSQNSVDTESAMLNCFDASEPVRDTFEEGTSQDCFDAEESAHDHNSVGETEILECFDCEGVKDSFDETVPEEECNASETAEDSKADYEENFIIQETFDVGEASVRYEEEGTENYSTQQVEEAFVSEDCSSPSRDDDLTCQEMSPVEGAVPTVGSVASVDEDIVEDADEQEEMKEDEEEQGNAEVIEYSFNTEERGMNDSVEPEENFAEAPEGRGIVPEVEDVTCDSGGETVLVMNHKVCSEEGDVSKPNVCTEEEIMYADHLSSVQSVDEMIFHKRSTVIDTGNTCASLHVSDSSAMKGRDNSLLCELPQREATVMRYCEDYGAMDVSSVFPKRVCNSVCISPIPQPPVRELYVYDPSAQNMTFCRNNIIDARSLPVNPSLNGLETYSFHQIPVESSSGLTNINNAYVHTNSGLCPVLQESRLEFDNRDMRPTKKLPAEEDFMRRIEKTLFESKIETKINDAIDSKYKAELDLSLPLKKRLRTLAAMSSISCTPEKCVTPKEESFPSYPAKPMISIAELEFTEGLIPKPGKTYQDNYK